MVELTDYMQFTDSDVEQLDFYNYVKNSIQEIRYFANGEYFECLLNGVPYRFLHAVFGENSWYEIYKLEE